MNNKMVIIGGGVAAINAIKAIRECDCKAEIHLFQNERFYPYNRIRLTKSLFDNLEESKILLQKKEWYEVNNISLHLNSEVSGIYTDKQEIILADGSSFSYDKLLLATGSSNFTPPIEGIDKGNVYTIRQLQDIESIKANIDDKENVLIIGGGIQGLETSWILSQHDKEITIAEVQERLMPRQLDEKASKILQKAIESFKIKMLLNTQIDRLLGEKDVQGAKTKDGGEIPSDMVIYSAGIRPNKKVVLDTKIKTNIGVIVDENMKTNIKNIYAAGDVAEIDGKVGGLWNIAIEQGKTAGLNMAGQQSSVSKVASVTTLNAFNITLFSMGDINESNSDFTLLEEGSDGVSSYKRIFIKDNKIIGAIVIGDTRKSPILKSAIEKEITLSDCDLTNITVEELISKLKNN